MFRNLRVSGKLLLGFGIVMAISAIMMIISIFSLQSVGGLTNDLYQKPMTVSTQSLMMQRDLHSMGREMRGMCLYNNLSVYDKVTQLSGSIRGNLAVIGERFLGDRQIVEHIASDIDTLDAMGEQVYKLVEAGKAQEGAKLLDAEYGPLFLSMIDESQAIVDFSMNTGLTLNNNASSTLNGTTILLVVLLAVILIVSMIIISALTRAISRPVAKIAEAANKMASGLLDVQIDYQAKDELGALSDSFQRMRDSLKSVITDVDTQLGAMAAGNFTTEPRVEYVGDYVSVKEALNYIGNSLSNTLNQIDQSASQVSAGSDQVSSGAQALSQGATEQASSIEELAATLSEISVQIKGNAENAQTARSMAFDTGGQMVKSNEQMKQMTAAMDDISRSSSEIGKIIKTIEDIAFQTNILALNAAVEAARAGAAGKGFAVVADEVRNLASKSADASKSTSSLIEDSLRAVEIGSKIAEETAGSLSSAVESAKIVTDKIDKITRATEDQANSINQVTQGVDQISSVVQTNSATAEESAAASEELSGQAQMLKNLINKFELKGSDFGSGSQQIQVRPQTSGSGKYERF